ncbi:MAG: ArsR/SmtB family transcription factor, partial [Candidatus Neoclostridium sp.]
MALKHKREITILKALADDNRLEVLKLLQGGEKCACRLLEALEIGQPTLSHHMRILCEAGLV